MRKRRILEIVTERVHRGDGIEIAVKPENVQNGGIGADCDAHAAALQVPQRHHGHTSPLGDQFCRETPPKASGPDSFTETREPAFHRREQRRDSLCHAIILAHF